MAITLTPEQVHRWAEALRGTTNSLEHGLQSIDIESYDAITDIALESLQALDDLVFQCDTCGWWCEISEMAETEDDCQQVCRECEG